MKIKHLLAATALAACSVTSVQASELIVGVKGGLTDVKSSGFGDPATVGTVQLGYEFLDLIAADIAAELELTSSLNDGEAGSDDYAYSSQGIFISARTLGPLYAIGRVGIVSAEIELDKAGTETDDTGTSVGVGIGFSTGLRWELEASRTEFKDDSITQLTLGVHF